eukprot:TRINITY_DN10282_c0_g1_i1.p1 TRINITY_DN10282_c0_g1~~TRINITY_DN10282_c0_g1_i1.p1  ORF type:complete len:272 (-),score=58.17 TRINITY_DN10282_c0_g1_i1:188-1003(-)
MALCWPKKLLGGLSSKIRSMSSQALAMTFVHPSAELHPTAVLMPGAVVLSNAKIGANVTIGCGSIVGEGVSIQESSHIGFAVKLSNCTIGSYSVIHHGVSVGQDGFGFLPANPHKGQMHPQKKPQLLSVEIGSFVEIGANTTIDRGSWRNTVIGNGCKIDNLVQVGHNVHIGQSCLIAAQVGIAGSTTIGDFVMIGGQVGIAQHLKIANEIQIAGKSGVMNNLLEKGVYGGTPAVFIKDFHRQTLALRSLSDPQVLRRLADLKIEFQQKAE